MEELELKNKITEFVGSTNNIVVSDNESMITACETVKELKNYENQVVLFFKDMKEQAHLAHKNICEKEKRYIEPIKACINDLTAKISSYNTKVYEEKEAKLNEERKMMENLFGYELDVAKPTQDELPKGVSTKIMYTAIVENEDKVPVKYGDIVIRPVCTKLLEDIANSTNGNIKIDGVKFVKETKTIIRRN